METREVELFGEKVLLSEFTTEDFFSLSSFQPDIGDEDCTEEIRNGKAKLRSNVYVASLGLKTNIKPLPFILRFKKRKKIKAWNYLFTQEHIFKKMGINEGGKICDIISEISGLEKGDDLKKKAGLISDDTSQEQSSVTSSESPGTKLKTEDYQNISECEKSP